MENKTYKQDHTYSYQELRKAVGIIGISLPFVLSLGNYLLASNGIEPSISDYYNTIMGDVFVGALFAVALFMFYYSGYDLHDNIVGKIIIGASAIGVALFSLKFPIHFAFAAIFFLALSYFSIFSIY